VWYTIGVESHAVASRIAQDSGAELHLRVLRCRRGLAAAAALAVTILAAGIGTGTGAAATSPKGSSAKLHPAALEYTNECPADDGGDSQETLAIKASCRAQVERLEELHADLASLETELETQGAAIVSAVEGIEPGGDGGLTQPEHDALNLTWWGVWAIVGLTLVGLVVPYWWRAWNFEGKLGRG